MKRLIIAEKPDMARAFASYLFSDNYTKGNGCLISGDTTITWAFGHMLKNAMPGDYGDAFKSWSAYPIFPSEWLMKVDANCVKQFKVIQELLQSADEVIHGGDPDREGQLLIDEILTYCDYKGPIKRVLANAKDNDSLARAFDNLEDNKKYYNLYQSGLCRSQADWLIGMNLTRLYTHRSKSFGHRESFRVGRVKTPTLALIVQREHEIKNFTSIKHYSLQGTFEQNHLSFNAKHVLSETLKQSCDANGYLTDRALLDGLLLKLQDQPAIVKSVNYSEGVTEPPLSHSLDTLQVEANSVYGYSPKQVLELTQSLYEKAYVSYPRSDCNYIPTSQHDDASKILGTIRNSIELPSIDSLLDSSQQSKAFNDKKVTAHHAIIPTSVLPKSLTTEEKNIYELIALRYLIQFMPPEKWNKVEYTIGIADEEFKGSGKEIVSPGFKVVLAKTKKQDEDETDSDSTNSILPSLKEGDTPKVSKISVNEAKTKPPKRFTEGTLIKAMANIYQFIPKDEPLREKLKELKGIGTPATRDTIIAELLSTNSNGNPCLPLVSKKGKELLPTAWGEQYIKIMHADLTTPLSTAIMESYLAKVESGEYSLNEYINILKEMISSIIKKVESQTFPFPTDYVEGKLTPCPICKEGQLLKKKAKNENRFFYICSNPNCHHPVTLKKVFYKDSPKGPVIHLCDTCQVVTTACKGPYGDYYHCPSCHTNYSAEGKKKKSTNK